MQQATTNYKLFQDTSKDERDYWTKQIVKRINLEREAQGWRYRVGTKWKKLGKITPRLVAIRCNMIGLSKDEDREWLYSQCKHAKNFSSCFFYLTNPKNDTQKNN